MSYSSQYLCAFASSIVNTLMALWFVPFAPDSGKLLSLSEDNYLDSGDSEWISLTAYSMAKRFARG